MQLLRSLSANSASTPSKPAPTSREQGWFITSVFPCKASGERVFWLTWKSEGNLGSMSLQILEVCGGKKKNQGSAFKVEKSSWDADHFQKGRRTMKLVGVFQWSSMGFGSCSKQGNGSSSTKTKWGLSIRTRVEGGGRARGNQRSACDRWPL